MFNKNLLFWQLQSAITSIYYRIRFKHDRYVSILNASIHSLSFQTRLRFNGQRHGQIPRHLWRQYALCNSSCHVNRLYQAWSFIKTKCLTFVYDTLNSFFIMKIGVFWLKFNWTMFLRVLLTMGQWVRVRAWCRTNYKPLLQQIIT